MVTVAEIARNIGIPATTAREYVGRFKPFFPTKKVTGKRYPMHPESAESIMRDIVDSYAKSKTTDDITNALKEKYPMDADVVDEETHAETNGHHKSNGKSLSTESSTLEMISRMSSMQMQLMQKMTEVLDRNNEVMERVIDALDKNGTKRKQEQLAASVEPKTPPPPPKKFIMPSREEMEKRKQKSWLGRMFGG